MIFNAKLKTGEEFEFNFSPDSDEDILRIGQFYLLFYPDQIEYCFLDFGEWSKEYKNTSILRDIIRGAIIDTLESSGWVKNVAARKLGITKATLQGYINRMQIKRSGNTNVVSIKEVNFGE